MNKVSQMPCLLNTFFNFRMVSAVLTLGKTRHTCTVFDHEKVALTFVLKKVCCNSAPWSVRKGCAPHGLNSVMSIFRAHVAVSHHLLYVTRKPRPPNRRSCIFPGSWWASWRYLRIFGLRISGMTDPLPLRSKSS